VYGQNKTVDCNEDNIQNFTSANTVLEPKLTGEILAILFLKY